MTHVHHVPGRLRLRLSRLKRNSAVAHAVEQTVRQLHGVRGCEPNLLTGSLVIHYDPARTNSTALISALRSAGYAQEERHPEVVCKAAPQRKPVDRLARKAAEAVIWHVIEAAVERSVPMLLLALL